MPQSRFMNERKIADGIAYSPTCTRIGLAIPAWVVVGIDIVKLKGRLAVDLYDGLSASHGEVVHVGVEKRKAPSDERGHLVGFEFIAHANFERARNDGDVFSVRVPMGRDAEPIRHLQANREVARGGGWVAFQDGELRAGTHHWRRRTPWNGIRGERICFVRVIMCGTGEGQPRPRENSSHCKCKGQVSFHD